MPNNAVNSFSPCLKRNFGAVSRQLIKDIGGFGSPVSLSYLSRVPDTVQINPALIAEEGHDDPC